MQKRGEKSNRLDNDVDKHKCKDCNVCPYGIYELVVTPGATAPETVATSRSSTSASKSRAYTPHLRRVFVSANLARYFSASDNEPVSLNALDAGGGGDCLFHCVAAIAEKIVFDTPAEATRFEPHLRREDFFNGKAHVVSKLRSVVADQLINLPPEVFLNIIVSSMNQETAGAWPDAWSPARELQSAGFGFLVTAKANVVEAVGENEDGAPGDMIVQYNKAQGSAVHVLKNGAVNLLQLQENIRAIWQTPGNVHWGTVTDAERLASTLRLGLIIFADVGQRRYQGSEGWIYGTNMEDATYDYWGLLYCISNQHFQVAEASSLRTSTSSSFFRREQLPASISAHYNSCNNSCPIGTSIVGRVI